MSIAINKKLSYHKLCTVSESTCYAYSSRYVEEMWTLSAEYVYVVERIYVPKAWTYSFVFFRIPWTYSFYYVACGQPYA